MLDGLLIRANMAGEPSPPYLQAPVPAIVVIIPVLLSTLLMRLFVESAMYMLPCPSNATSVGPHSVADVARIPSPLYSPPP